MKVFVIALGRAGEDAKAFKITDVEGTFESFAGADYDIQVTTGYIFCMHARHSCHAVLCACIALFYSGSVFGGRLNGLALCICHAFLQDSLSTADDITNTTREGENGEIFYEYDINSPVSLSGDWARRLRAVSQG